MAHGRLFLFCCCCNVTAVFMCVRLRVCMCVYNHRLAVITILKLTYLEYIYLLQNCPIITLYINSN